MPTGLKTAFLPLMGLNSYIFWCKNTTKENSERHGAGGNSKIHIGQYSNDYKIFNST